MNILNNNEPPRTDSSDSNLKQTTCNRAQPLIRSDRNLKSSKVPIKEGV